MSPDPCLFLGVILICISDINSFQKFMTKLVHSDSAVFSYELLEAFSFLFFFQKKFAIKREI